MDKKPTVTPRTGRPPKAKLIEVVIGPSIAYVPLSRGLYALIDSEDAERLQKWNWYAHFDKTGDCFYAFANDPKRHNKCRSIVKMHRVLLNAESGQIIDHCNRNSLDNRTSNIRFATASQNQANTKVKKNSKSGFKGVWQNKAGRFQAYIGNSGKMRYLGTKSTAEEAHQLYMAEARKVYKDFARSS